MLATKPHILWITIASLCACSIALALGFFQDCYAQTQAQTRQDSMEYRYWDWGGTPKRDDYQIALLTLALEKTIDSYGPYKVSRVVQAFSTSRLRREINRGEVVNVHAGPWRPVEVSEDKLDERSLRINIPILRDLLGYRQLLIRRDDLEKFKHITLESDLKKLVAGQGRGWLDVEIYRQNGYQVDDSPNQSTLFNMLANKRFDYVPISIIEAESALAKKPEMAKQLTMAPGIIIYFPLPIIFYVNIHEPKLAQRLEKGLDMAKKDGSFERLFQQFFSGEIQIIRNKQQRNFILKSSFLPKELTIEKPLFSNLVTE